MAFEELIALINRDGVASSTALSSMVPRGSRSLSKSLTTHSPPAPAFSLAKQRTET